MQGSVTGSVKLNKFIWLFPLLFLIHDIEEIMTIEEFLRSKGDFIPIKVTTLQFSIAFFLLWILSLIGCFQAAKNKPFLGMNPVTFFCFLVPGIFLANGVGHLLQAIIFLGYVPGIITTLVIIFPYSIIALRFLIHENLLTIKRFWLFFLLGFIIQGPFALIALILAKAFI